MIVHAPQNVTTQAKYDCLSNCQRCAGLFADLKTASCQICFAAALNWSFSQTCARTQLASLHADRERLLFSSVLGTKTENKTNNSENTRKRRQLCKLRLGHYLVRTCCEGKPCCCRNKESKVVWPPLSLKFVVDVQVLGLWYFYAPAPHFRTDRVPGNDRKKEQKKTKKSRN